MKTFVDTGLMETRLLHYPKPIQGKADLVARGAMPGYIIAGRGRKESQSTLRPLSQIV